MTQTLENILNTFIKEEMRGMYFDGDKTAGDKAVAREFLGTVSQPLELLEEVGLGDAYGVSRERIGIATAMKNYSESTGIAIEQVSAEAEAFTQKLPGYEAAKAEMGERWAKNYVGGALQSR